MFQVFSKFIGILSALAILIFVGMAVFWKIRNRPQLEWDYVKETYGPDGQGIPSTPGTGEGPRDIVDLSKDSIERINKCRDFLDKKMASSKEPIYGINTGFGSLCNCTISNDDLEKLQKNQIVRIQFSIH